MLASYVYSEWHSERAMILQVIVNLLNVSRYVWS